MKPGLALTTRKRTTTSESRPDALGEQRQQDHDRERVDDLELGRLELISKEVTIHSLGLEQPT